MAQGSVSGYLLFLIYVHDLPNDTQLLGKHFVDDIDFSKIIYNSLTHGLNIIKAWVF